MIGAYNFNKVGTDRMDQVVAAHYGNRRFRWHIKMFVHLAYIALQNAHVCWRQLNKKTLTPSAGFLAFILAVVDEFTESMAVKNKVVVARCTHTPATHGAARSPASSPTVGLRSPSNKSKRQRRTRFHCKQCHVYTSYWCVECDVHLHIHTAESSSKTCWSDWHRAHHPGSGY